jgi:hypothetical protein
MKFDTYTYTIGAHFLPAIMNGDLDLSLEDENALASFDANLPGAGHWTCDDEEERYARCEITGQFGSVVVCSYHIPVTTLGD